MNFVLNSLSFSLRNLRSRTNPFRNCSSSFSVDLPRSGGVCTCKHCGHIHDQDSYQPHRWLLKSVTSKIYQQSQSTTRPKAKLRSPIGDIEIHSTYFLLRVESTPHFSLSTFWSSFLSTFWPSFNCLVVFFYC